MNKNVAGSEESLLSGSRGLIYSRDYGKNKLKTIFSVVPIRPQSFPALSTSFQGSQLVNPTSIFLFVICLLSAAQWECFRHGKLP